MERPNVFPKSDKPYTNNEEDTYLTLEILADILETLSESGKSIYLVYVDTFSVFKTLRAAVM